MKFIIIGLGIVALITISKPIMLFLSIFWNIFWYSNDMCGNYVHSEYLSPSQSHKAIIFQRDCGATTGFSTQISIMDINEELKNTTGNIYIIDGHPDKVAPDIVWITESELLISRPLTGEEHKAKTSINKIEVKYGDGSS